MADVPEIEFDAAILTHVAPWKADRDSDVRVMISGNAGFSDLDEGLYTLTRGPSSTTLTLASPMPGRTGKMIRTATDMQRALLFGTDAAGAVAEAITESAAGFTFAKNANFSWWEVLGGIFPNYDGYDGMAIVADLPPGSTVTQANGVSSYVRARADNLIPGLVGGLAVNYFGASIAEGQGSGAWFANAAIADNLTPANIVGSTTARKLVGIEPDFYVFRDDTEVFGIQLAGNSRMWPAKSLGFTVSNMSQVRYFTANTTADSATITNISSPGLIYVGMPIAGDGIPSKAYIVAVNAGAATAVMSAPATATASAASLDSSIPWDNAFVSQDGAAAYGLIVGALVGGPADPGPSYSQYIALRYKSPTGAFGVTEIQSDPFGRLIASGAIVDGSEHLASSGVPLASLPGSSTATLANAPVSGNPTHWLSVEDADGRILAVPAWRLP